MRTIRKRLTCVNRNDGEKNRVAMQSVIDRYVSKMQSKGWYYIPHLDDTAGNAFWYWEHYLSIFKPNLKSKDDLNLIAEWESEYICKLAQRRGLKKDGVFVMNELKKRDWECLSYVNSSAIASEFSLFCGYSGGYNQSKLVKIF